MEYKEYNLDTLFALENEEILRFKGKQMVIITRDGKTISGIATGFGLAANPPHLVCTIVIDGAYSISLPVIKSLKIKS